MKQGRLMSGDKQQFRSRRRGGLRLRRAVCERRAEEQFRRIAASRPQGLFASPLPQLADGPTLKRDLERRQGCVVLSSRGDRRRQRRIGKNGEITAGLPQTVSRPRLFNRLQAVDHVDRAARRGCVGKMEPSQRSGAVSTV